MKRLSIRYRITVYFSVAMILITALSFLLVRVISASVMQKTIRGYLISAVDANIDKLVYCDLSQGESEKKKDANDIFLRYGDGFLQIDDGFLDVINDVESALYQQDGTMLYGKNPIARDMENATFSGSRIYRINVRGAAFFVYDRKLVGKELDGLWIRGIVPLTQEAQQLSEITRITLVFLPFLILVAIVTSLMVATGILQPIQEIEQAAADISKGTDLKKRLTLGAGKDEVHKLAITFNAMLNRLEESFEAERRFTSDASHELRTPVAVILAQTELVLEKGRSKEEYQEALAVIRRQSIRMHALINDMLDYTRLERQTDEYPMEPLNLSELVETICGDMKVVERCGIALRKQVESDLAVTGNRMLLTRMLLNLMDNAYKYGREGGYVEVVLERESSDDDTQKISLSVADNGIGIPEENQRRIFDRFFRGDHSRTRQNPAVSGNGLGLSMVKKIAELHGAEITLESREGIGSKFTVHF